MLHRGIGLEFTGFLIGILPVELSVVHHGDEAVLLAEVDGQISG